MTTETYVFFCKSLKQSLKHVKKQNQYPTNYENKSELNSYMLHKNSLKKNLFKNFFRVDLNLKIDRVAL